jgi:RNA-binding motif protein, X-linked 2
VNVHRSSHTFIYCSVVREINKINECELELGVGTASWHDEYKGRTGTDTITLFGAHDASDSAHIFIGGLHYGLTEGDVISIFSQ